MQKIARKLQKIIHHSACAVQRTFSISHPRLALALKDKQSTILEINDGSLVEILRDSEK